MPSDESSKTNPRARMAYRLIGAVLAAIFGVVIIAAGIEEGYPIVGVSMGAFMAFAMIFVFWVIAEDEYHGEPAGLIGGLVEGGDRDD